MTPKAMALSAVRMAKMFLCTYSERSRRADSKACRRAGQTVQFDVTKGPKGWQAENVQPL